MKLILAGILLFVLCGCSTFGPITATGSPQGEKMGTACKTWIIAPILPLMWGRNDIREAALTGKIDKISVVDYEVHWYLLFGKTCTNVYGQ